MMMMTFLVGKRGRDSANAFIADLALASRTGVQLTTDGNFAYTLDINGGTKAERDAAMAWAKKYEQVDGVFAH